MHISHIGVEILTTGVLQVTLKAFRICARVGLLRVGPLIAAGSYCLAIRISSDQSVYIGGFG